MRSSMASNTFGIGVGTNYYWVWVCVCEREFRRQTGKSYRIGRNFVWVRHMSTHCVDTDPCGSRVMFS